MSTSSLADEIKLLAEESGADLIGFADLRNLPDGFNTGYPFGVSIGVALNPEIIADITGGPTAAYYGEYTRVNALLNSIAEKVSHFLRDKGCNTALSGATDTAIDSGADTTKTDMSTLSGQLSHKMVATRAGLGWVGKNDLLTTREYGSAVRLNSILTDAELPVSEPCESSGCGTCRVCVDVCPAGALTGKEWHPGIEREALVDVFTCRETMRDLMLKNTGETASICGVCIAVCPWTRRYLKSEDRLI